MHKKVPTSIFAKVVPRLFARINLTILLERLDVANDYIPFS